MSTVVFTIQFGTAGLTQKLGMFCDSGLTYFIFRNLVRDVGAIRALAHAFVVVAIPTVVAFMVEHQTGRNAFAVFGGVPEMTEVREGTLRCQGAFAHSILAGCFWASVLPLIMALWWQPGIRRRRVVVGITCGLAIIVLCASSTPIVGVVVGVAGGCLFVLRRHLRVIKWGLVFVLVALHIVMKAPVWSLIQRVDIIGGSTGWYRYQLLNAAIEHFREWWLLGTPSTDSWGMVDMTNQFILEGVRGGIFSVALYVLIFARAFRKV